MAKHSRTDSWGSPYDINAEEAFGGPSSGKYDVDKEWADFDARSNLRKFLFDVPLGKEDEIE